MNQKIKWDPLHLQVDEQAAYIAQYDGGELAVMISGVRTGMPDTACIYGTKGYIEVPHFYKPSEITVITEAARETISIPVPQSVPGVEDEGFRYEIMHVNDCLRKGLKESPIVRHADTLRILQQCDSLRKDWNFVYPFEK